MDIGGTRVARARDARWCLDFLDELQAFVSRHGRFDPATREAHFGDFLAVVDDARSFVTEYSSPPTVNGPGGTSERKVTLTGGLFPPDACWVRWFYVVGLCLLGF